MTTIYISTDLCVELIIKGYHVLIESEILEKLHKEMVTRFNQLDDKVDRLARIKDCLDGDKLIDNQDLGQHFNVVPRTMARYREKQLSPIK